MITANNIKLITVEQFCELQIDAVEELERVDHQGLLLLRLKMPDGNIVNAGQCVASGCWRM